MKKVLSVVVVFFIFVWGLNIKSQAKTIFENNKVEATNSLQNDILENLEAETCEVSFEETNQAFNQDLEECNFDFIFENQETTYQSQTADVSLRGTLEWKEGNKIFPLQFNLVELWGRASNRNDIKLDSTYTDSNGFYYFEFENKGYDIFVRVIPAGESIRVYKENGENYQEDSGLCENVKTGAIYSYSRVYEMVTDTGDSLKQQYFSQALQIAQAMIFSSKYAKEMNGGNIDDVSIRYAINSTNCYYQSSNKTIYISGPSDSVKNNLHPYSSWDVLMHEYGHHVLEVLSIDVSLGGGHYAREKMGDHYKCHYSGGEANCECGWNQFPQTECKLQGTRIAWSEGFATYFMEVAQEYFSASLKEVPKVGDKRYSAFNTKELNIFHKNYLQGDDEEFTIAAVLYELNDDISSETISLTYDDLIVLGHQGVWDLIMKNRFTSFQDFDTFFRSKYSSNNEMISNYVKILSHYGFASYPPTLSHTTTVGPTVSWQFETAGLSTTFNIYYDINFYDSNKNFIIKMETTSQERRVKIEDDLWEKVIKTGLRFYVSITKIEDKVEYSCYEGEWSEFWVTQPEIIKYGVSISKTLPPAGCQWYIFTAPQEGTYIFETTGHPDLKGELFSKIVYGRKEEEAILSDDNSGEGNNFKLVYSMKKNETIYLRVRYFDWNFGGPYNLTVSSEDHIHIFTQSYSSLNASYHTALCECGMTTKEAHTFQLDGAGNRCKYCGYFTGGPVIAPWPFSSRKKETESLILTKKEDEFLLNNEIS